MLPASPNLIKLCSSAEPCISRNFPCIFLICTNKCSYKITQNLPVENSQFGHSQQPIPTLLCLQFQVVVQYYTVVFLNIHYLLLYFTTWKKAMEIITLFLIQSGQPIFGTRRAGIPFVLFYFLKRNGNRGKGDKYSGSKEWDGGSSRGLISTSESFSVLVGATFIAQK